MSPEVMIAGEIDAALRAKRGRSPLVVGLCGAQGSGKSTIAAALARRFSGTVVLSLDDLYKTRAERAEMARICHPLFRTRGVPGTHDIGLGVATLAALDRGEAVSLPRFDKAVDDRVDPLHWPVQSSACSLVILEGWCVGALPEAASALERPVNALEHSEDPDGTWRRMVNDALAGYQRLFARIDHLILLLPPSFDVIQGWRMEQERALRSKRGAALGVMTSAEISRFVAHFERLTRHIMREMPSRAALVVPLDDRRKLIQVAIDRSIVIDG